MLKNSSLLGLSLLFLPISGQAATIFSADFESGTVGAPPTGIFSGISAPTNTTVAIADTYNSTRGKTLYVFDNSATVTENDITTTGTNPNITQSLGSTYGNYIYSFDYKLEGGGYIQRTEFTQGTGSTRSVDIRFDGGMIKLISNASTSVTVASSALFTTFAGWNTGGWNNFSYEVNDATDNIIVRINGVVALNYTYETPTSLATNRFQINVGYSSNKGDAASFDNISFVAIPEPSTGLISLLALGLAARRKR